MDRVVGELQRRALELRTTPLLRIVEPLPRMARDVAQRLEKRVEVELRLLERAAIEPQDRATDLRRMLRMNRRDLMDRYGL